jgi:hypothetical protein
MSSPPRQRRRLEEPSAPSRVIVPLGELYPLPPEPKPTPTDIRYRELHGKYSPTYTKKHNEYLAEVARIEKLRNDNRVYMVHPVVDGSGKLGGSCCPICGENVMEGGTRWLFPNKMLKTDDEMAEYRRELEKMPETEKRSNLYYDLWEADKNPIPDVIEIASPTKPISVNKYIGILLAKGVGMREAEKIAVEQQKHNPKFFHYPKPTPKR